MFTASDVADVCLRAYGRDRSTKRDDFAAKWYELLQKGDEQALLVDKARRKVKAYFHKAARLREYKLIQKKTLKGLAYWDGINIYYDIVDPLELALNPDGRRVERDLLMDEIGRYETRQLLTFVPRTPSSK